jgi:peroxiredoxin
MMKTFRFHSLVASLLALSGASAAQAAPVAGDPAPPFSLVDSNGKTHSLSDFSGKIVVLEWINYGCPYVQKHYDSGNMQSLQRKFTDEGVVWLSICSSAPGKQGHLTPEAWNRSVGKYKSAPTAILIDESGEVGRSYGARTTPQMGIIDPEGRIAYRGAIDSEATTNQADIAKARNYVADALNALLAGDPVPLKSSKPYGCSVKY